MSRRVYGKAFPITEKQARSYDKASKPKKKAYRPNPIGVTSMAMVNGKGAYKRAKSLASAAEGLSKKELEARARKVMKGNTTMRKTTRRRKPAMPKRNAKGRFVKNKAVGASKSYSEGWDRMQRAKKRKAAKKTTTTAKKTAAKKSARKAPARKAPARAAAPKKSARKAAPEKSVLKATSPKKSARKAPKRKSVTERYPQFEMVAAKKRKRVRYGKYKRRTMLDPMTNRMRQTFMYFDTETGRFRKIPKSALKKYGKFTDSTISEARRKAARKVEKVGTAFTPNSRKKKMKKNPRIKAGSAAAKRRGKKAAQTRKRNLAAKRAAAKRAAAKRSGAKRSGAKRSGAKAPKRRTLRQVHMYVKNKRRRSMFRKNGFTSSFLGFLKTGALVTTGFFAHKALTHLLSEKVVNEYILKADSASDFVQKLRPYSKPITGLAVLIPGLLLTNYAADMIGKGNRATANYLKTSVGAGMVASWLQTTVVTVLAQLNQPSVLPYLQGYEDSTAASLMGYTPVNQSGAQSIMPQYQAVGDIYQAAAGFSQAAAGYHQAAAGTGEYFAANATGEYFAPPQLKGIGAYEEADGLAVVHTDNTIMDGIRPDTDLDHELNLAEAAAGVGAYEGAGGRVPTTSTWIPGQSNPAVWAPKTSVQATVESSDIPAGVLKGQGGNGILSA